MNIPVRQAALGVVRLAVCALACSAAMPALAADPVLGTGAPSGKKLGKSQLAQCLDLQARLEAQGAQSTRARAELETAKAEFDRFEAQLQTERAALQASDKAAVDAYNAKLDKRRQMVADYNARTPQAQAQQQAYADLGRQWKGDCENRPYDADDYAALRPRR